MNDGPPYLVDQYGRVHADQSKVVDGEMTRRIRYYGVAFLSDHPEAFDPDKQKLHSCPIDIEEDVKFYQKHVDTTCDNNFATSVSICRALYSWLTIEQINSSDPIVLSRDTSTGLPPGDYVFKVYRSTLEGYSESVPKVPSPLGDDYFPVDPYPDWHTATDIRTKKGLCWDPFVYQDNFADMSKDITVRISKSDWHSNASSVDDDKGKGRKVKNSKGQTAPSQAKGQ
jgi:hypothetical protein